MPNLPTGIVTFLFTDIEGSTKIAQAYPEEWERLRGRHYDIVRNAIQLNDGFVFQLVGDEFCSSFHHPINALRAALSAQHGLQNEKWDFAPIKVRMGIYTGAAQVGDLLDRTGYTGYAALAGVNRVMSAGHGGQILLSNSSAELVRSQLPQRISLRDMGEHRLKGLLTAERLWQVEAPGLMCDFPPLKTLTTIPNSQVEQLADFVTREKGIAFGLEKLEAEMPLRAPVLIDTFQKLAEPLRPFPTERTYQERFDALKKMNDLCLEVLDISFITLCSGETPPAYDARCPFRGLESFRPEDSEFFFGRQELIKKLVGRINSHPFLAVLGASGSGKSSLVMAGLIPVLTSEYAVFRPGTEPHIQLTTALASVKENALIVVDQFEEVFTLTTNEAARRQFIADLLEARRRHKIVITLRSDFLGEVASYRALNDAIQNHLENVPPMDMDELYQAMAGQAGHTGLRFEADLGQRILDDLVGEPGAMPLLQHALWMLWKRRHGLWLKTHEYQDFGGVKQAIASTAEDVYNACSESDRRHVRDIFLRLTRLDESNEGRDTRRRVPLHDLLIAGRDASANTLLLDKLANSRLIVKTVNDARTEIEVAHEALIRHWERLQDWLNEDRNKLRLRGSVGESAKEWENAEKDEVLLNHRGGRLDDALLLNQDVRYGLTLLEHEYLNECAALRTREQLARERRLRWTIMASASAAIIFLVLGIFGWIQRNEAVVQSKIALARQLAAQAQTMSIAESRQSVALLLAVQSMKIDPSPEASQVLLGKNFAAHLISRMSHDAQVESLALSPDGRYIASGSADNTVRVWETATGKEIARMDHDDFVYSVAFSPDGRRLVSGSWDHSVRIWDALTGKEIARMNHTEAVYVVAYSPDGEHVISGSLDDTARVWGASTGKEIARMHHDGDVYAVAFSPDGKYAASGSLDNTARVWEAATGKEIERVTHDGEVYVTAFSPDGKYLATGGWDDTVRVWEVSTGELISNTMHDASVNSAVFSPDGTYVVAASIDKTARVWEISTGREISRMVHDGEIYAVAVSRDNRYVVSGSDDGTARMWELATGREVARMTHDAYVFSVGFTPDGRYVASGSYDHTIRVWGISEVHAVLSMDHADSIQSMAVSPNGDYIASGSSDGTAQVWHAATGKEISRMVHEGGDVAAVVFSPDGKYVASAGSDNTARIWEAATGKEVARMSHNAAVWGVAFSPDGKYVASGAEDATVRVWEASTGKEVARMEHGNGVMRVAFSADGQHVASTSWDNTARVWDAFSGKEVLRITHDDYPVAATFSPDGKYIASGGWDKTVRLVEVATGQEVERLALDNEVEVLAFSPDGKYLASGGWDKAVRVWETATGKEVARLNHENAVDAIAFSADGNHIISGSYDNTARLWEVASGREIARMAHDDVVRAVAFMPDGMHVASGGSDKTVRVWEWQTEDLIDKACANLPRNLTRAEWDRYIGGILPYQPICPNLPLEP